MNLVSFDVRMRKVWKFLFGICLMLVCIACVKDVDFDQAEDVVLTPVLELDFIYSEINTGEFIDAAADPTIVIPTASISDTLNYDLLGTDFVVDNLERIELTFEFENTIPRDFTFTLGFLNDAEQRIGPTYTLVARAGNGLNTEPVRTVENIILDAALINELSPTQKVVTAVDVQNVSLGLEGMLELRSKGTYFINYDL